MKFLDVSKHYSSSSTKKQHASNNKNKRL